MTEELKCKLDYLKSVLKEVEVYSHACAVISFDQETVCPPAGMEEQGDLTAFLGTKAFELMKQKEFIEAGEYIYAHKNELTNDFEVALAEMLHREYVETKNITPEMNMEFSKIYNRSYINWLNAKKENNFSLFAPSLKEVREVELKKIELNEEKVPVTYDNLLNLYERGMTSEDLDACFEKCKERLVPLLKKIMASKKNIRTDFLSRKVTDAQQREITDYILKTIGYDFEKGAWALTEHPFTNGLGKNDVRITTHFHEDMFYSNIYSVIHEGGHALFEMFQPSENYDNYINNCKTMGMHESVSRFYENRIGRSKEFIHLIYPKMKEVFPEVFCDVSEKEFYEAMNIVQPSLIRTEADEFTYTFHVIIRYEIEKEILAGTVKIEELPALWNKKYQEYLGICPSTDSEGVLQDVHWASGFGYFPAYAIGNMYNSMYIKKMEKDIDFAGCVEKGDFETINGWMKEHVWKKADRLGAKDWLKDITGESFSPDAFLEYLETKYSELYEL